MSDAPMGPDWWLGQDGKYYPPAAPVTAPKKSIGGGTKALVIIAACVLLLLFFAAIGNSSTDKPSTQVAGAPPPSTTTTTQVAGVPLPSTTTATTTPPTTPADCKDLPVAQEQQTARRIYPGRPDIQEHDDDVAVGDCTDIDAWKLVVREALLVPSGDFDVKVFAHNNGDKRNFPLLTFSVIRPDKQVSVCDSTDLAGTNELLNGADISGIVSCDGAGPGDYYIVFEPNKLFTPGRGVWKVTV